MTFSLAIANGDLVTRGSELAIVQGTDKLRQDLTLWLAERFGIDRFHPAMGSNFQNYIGGVISQNTRAMIYSEALRVLDNYQKVQYMRLRESPSIFSQTELLWSINEINVGVGFDAVGVGINVSNGVQEPLAIAVAQGA